MKSEKKVISRRKPKKVSLTAWWGNNDASSSVIIPLSKWKKILDGMEFIKGGYSWYEGRRFHVIWKFNKEYNQLGKGLFTIYGDEDGRDCVRDEPLSSIRVQYMDED